MWTVITVLTSKLQLSPRVPPLARSPPGALPPVAALLARLPKWVGREGRARRLRAAAGPRELSLPGAQAVLGNTLTSVSSTSSFPANLPPAEFLLLQSSLPPPPLGRVHE